MKVTTIGYHTLEDQDNIDEVEANAPFKCTGRKAWLSEGYYFWEKDFERALKWGNDNYPASGCIILKYELILDNLFDLVGNRDHQKQFISLVQMLCDAYVGKIQSNVPISKAIHLLRALNERRNHDIFPYDSIRAQDHPDRKLYYFIDGKNEAMDLNPRIQICIFRKTQLHLIFISVEHPNKYRQ